jgi:hypothetical protein
MTIVHKTGIPGRVIAEILNGVEHRTIITNGEETGNEETAFFLNRAVRRTAVDVTGVRK